MKTICDLLVTLRVSLQVFRHLKCCFIKYPQDGVLNAKCTHDVIRSSKAHIKQSILNTCPSQNSNPGIWIQLCACLQLHDNTLKLFNENMLMENVKSYCEIVMNYRTKNYTSWTLYDFINHINERAVPKQEMNSGCSSQLVH